MLLITIIALMFNVYSLLILIKENNNYNYTQLARSIAFTSIECRKPIADCGIPVNVANSLFGINIISTFIKCAIGVILTINFPTVFNIITGLLLISVVIYYRVSYAKRLKEFILKRGKKSYLLILESILGILFFVGILFTILNEIF